MQQQQQFQTLMLNSSENYKRRNLLYEFGKRGGSEEGTEKVGSHAVPSGTAAVGGGNEKHFLFNQPIAVPTLTCCILAINTMEDLVMLVGLMPGHIL
jgi:hypothetical protein